MEATAANLKELEKQKAAEAERRATDKASAEALKAKLEKLETEVVTKAGEGGRIFGSITAKDISVTMDLSNYQNEGNYTVELQVELPDGYALESVPSIKVNLEKIQPVTETETETTEE